jgi:signal transduction histidine kinase
MTSVRTHAGLRTLVMRKSLGDQRAAVAVVRGALPVAGGVGVAIAVALGALLGFGLLRRLEHLRRDVRRLTEEGIGTPLSVDGAGTDEVGEVARALESMRARLHAQERGRQAFLSTASHELRTPVASLRGTAELLEEELRCADPDLGQARRRAAAVSRQAERLSALADDLLGLGRLDADIPLATEPLDLVELTGTLVGELEPVAQEAWAIGDLLATARIIRSLLDNGLRHGASPGSVLTVTVATGDDVATVAVRDAGDGVPEADRERIFGRFERAAAPGAGGFGLGLPIARGLARRMAGDVILDPLGPGACFTLALPACASPVGVERSLGRHAPAIPAR